MMLTETRDGYSTLIDYLLMLQSRGTKALEYEPRKVIVEDYEEAEESERPVIVKSVAEARFSVLLAEALEAMSQDIHAEDDRADTSAPLTTERAIILVKEFGGLRPAARATGISRSTFWRALKQANEAGAFV
jgi:DNA-binding phage protein